MGGLRRWAATTLDLAVETSRPQLDLLAFAIALALLAWAAASFVSAHNAAASVMCAMCLAGLVGGRVVGVPGRVLAIVALGLVFALWIIWVDRPGDPVTRSALAHGTGGIVAGWAIVEAARRRTSNWAAIAAVTLAGVVVIGMLWELGELIGDQVFDTSLIPSVVDSAADITFGTLGGAVGIALGAVVSRAGGLVGSRSR
jgi:hypothetical protein